MHIMVYLSQKIITVTVEKIGGGQIKHKKFNSRVLFQQLENLNERTVRCNSLMIVFLDFP